MPFGQKNAPFTSYNAMDVVLYAVKGQLALVLLDDVVIFSREPIEHMIHVSAVGPVLRDAGVSLNLPMLAFTSLIDYLGYIIQPGRLAISDCLIEAIQSHCKPTSVTKLRSFLFLAMCIAELYPGLCAFLTNKRTASEWLPISV